MANPKDDDRLKIILEVFTRNAAAAVRYISGRQLSLAELGAIRQQAVVALKSAFLRGMVSRFNKLQAHVEPWDPDNDPTDPFIPRKKPK